MSAQETNNASEETLHAPSHRNAVNDPSGTTIKAYDAEQDAGTTPLRTPLVARESEASSARTIRDETAGLDKEKGGHGNNGGEGDKPKRRPGLLERTTSGHTRIEKREDGKVELKEKAVYDQLGFSWSNSKKWWILSVSLCLLFCHHCLSSSTNAVTCFLDHFPRAIIDEHERKHLWKCT